MSNASKDANNVSSCIVALNTDGKTIIPIRVDSSNALLVSDSTSGTDHGPSVALRDGNNVPSLLGVSSSDFSTVVVVYGDVNGNLLVQST